MQKRLRAAADFFAGDPNSRRILDLYTGTMLPVNHTYTDVAVVNDWWIGHRRPSPMEGSQCSKPPSIANCPLFLGGIRRLAAAEPPATRRRGRI